MIDVRGRSGACVLSDDRDYCRAVLPRVSRTFALNIRLLRGTLGESVRVAYLLCRTADALEDSWPGTPQEIEERFERFRRALGGDPDCAGELARRAAGVSGGRRDLDLVAELPRVLRVHAALPAIDRQAIAQGVETLAQGMSRYAVRSARRGHCEPHARPYLEDEAELRDYCWVVAGCVGVMLTRLYEARATYRDEAMEGARLRLAPVVGEALQLTNILLDWPLDIRRGRCYVPARWLEALGLATTDLVDGKRTGAGEIVTRLESMARAALARVPEYLDTIPVRHVRYRLFCLWPALWARASLRHALRDPEFPWGPRRPRLPRGELWRTALGSLVAAHDPRSLRRLYAASG